MRLPSLVAAFLATLFLGGCAAYTVSPLYTKTDVLTDPAIVGAWFGGDKNSSGTLRIEAQKNGSYLASVHDDESGDNSVYEAHLVKLGSTSFADLLLTKSHHAGHDVDLPAGAVALHQIVKYQVNGDDLSYSFIDPDALKNSSTQPGFPLQFRDTQEKGGDTITLSDTEALRRYFSVHPSGIFGDADHLKRRH